MEAVDVCEKCEVSDWNSEDFMDESAFSCSDFVCYSCLDKHACTGQCYQEG